MSAVEDFSADYENKLDQILNELKGDDLEPCGVSRATELYFEERSDELCSSTKNKHRSSLRYFSEWCSNSGIHNLNNLTCRELKEYRTWRKEIAPTKTDTLKPASIKSEMDVIRAFLKTCEEINAVKPELRQAVQALKLKNGEGVSDAVLDPERAADACKYLSKYEYATREHLVMKLFATGGFRTGGLIAIDCGDYLPNSDPPRIKLRHRPDEGTRLKNGTDSERQVAVPSDLCEVIDDYLSTNRIDVTDEHGRRPLITTRSGRPAASTLRKYVYKWTRPCMVGRSCPHGENPEECVGTDNDAAYKCPSSRSPHAVRKGYITYELNNGIATAHLSGRCDVSEEVLKKHYDFRTEEEKMMLRRHELMQARTESKPYGGA